eukprot:Phypoly_transcript_01333.p1 GENE.Phypoly_transcript_01333~~Phypoly_transcript_01333.p1  ORF type:complete len:1144 (+),score=202.28 Phypoly_transcript_01333:98-3433(+)
MAYVEGATMIHTIAERVRGRSTKENGGTEDKDKPVEKSEEVDREAKRLLEEFSELDSLSEKAYFLLKLVRKPNSGVAMNTDMDIDIEERENEDKEDKNRRNRGDRDGNRDGDRDGDRRRNRSRDRGRDRDGDRDREKSKSRDDKKEKEGKERVKEERIVCALLAHLHIEELRELAAFFTPQYPELAKLINSRITNSSLLRTMFSRKRAILRCALEASIANAAPSPPLGYSSVATPAFDPKGYAIQDLKLVKFDTEELEHPLIPFSNSNLFGKDIIYGTPSVVPSLPIFRALFDSFTEDFFSDIDLQGSVFAGGSVLACLLPIPASMAKLYRQHREHMFTLNKLPLPQNVLDHILSFIEPKETYIGKFKQIAKDRFYGQEPFMKSDVDIFMLANTLEEAKEKLEKLYNSITKKYKKLGKEFIVVRTANAITICSEYPYRHIQLIIGALRTLDEFLLFADLDCTSVAYDGSQVFLSPRSIHALNTRCNIVPPKSFLNIVDKARLLKYVNRGFSAMVFELCKHEPRCDIELDREVQSAVIDLEKKEMQTKAIHDRAQYIDVRLPFGSMIGIREISDAASRVDQACIVGNTLHEVMTVTESEEMAGKKARENAEADEISKIEKSAEKEEDDDAISNMVREVKTIVEERERIEDEKQREREREEEREREREKRAKLKGIRWKVFDTIENRSSDDILPRCYTCKKRFMPATIEQVGLSLCKECASENAKMLERWDSLSDLSDCVALVTGARIKIGYPCSHPSLLKKKKKRKETRFPNDAARRYSLEPDYTIWKNKLHLYGVDLRHLPSVSEFMAHVLKSYTRIDILINNAAQTIRRPVAYYRALIRQESLLHSSNDFAPKFLVKGVNQDPFMIENYRHKNAIIEEEDTALAVTNSTHGVMMLSVSSPTDKSLPKSAALSQAKLLPMDMVESDDVAFPPGKFDEHDEPMDARESTSWTQTIEEISPIELMEVQTVNSTVPFMFISNFTPLLKNAAIVSKHRRSFVVNVTSAEGIFNMNKRGIHPHTNMAKAALNMMTKSISTTFAAMNIFATAVDTGWITKMKPATAGIRNEWGPTAAPLQDKDGAARILHPIYLGYSSRMVPPYGVLLQNYKVIPWT